MKPVETEAEPVKPLPSPRKESRFAFVGQLVRALEQTGVGRWPMQATALSYYSILGVVPFLALAFSIAKSFGLEQALTTAIHDFFTTFDGQEEALNRVREFADNLIGNYSGSVMAFVAIGVIFWSGFQILQLLETALGTIFGYRPPRRTIHRVLDYFAAMVILPMVVVLTAAINIFLTGLTNKSWAIPFGFNPNGVLSFLVVASPYLMWWLVLSTAYGYFSRGLARRGECLIGGLITSLIFQIFQSVYIAIMLSLTSYNAIYGSFAAIPLFMFWLYGSWLIVLAGGELTRRLSDNRASKRHFLQMPTLVTWKGTVELAQAVMAEVVKNFTDPDHGGGTTFRSLAATTGASMSRLGSVITMLMDVDLLVSIDSTNGAPTPSYLPATDPGHISDDLVREKLEEARLNVL